MDEFIIWDDGIHTFEEAMADKAPSGGFVPYDYTIKCDGYLKGALNGEYPSFKDIGLKDINGKSIYANSSIVEFTIREDGIKLPVNGYFKFDPIFLRYYIRIIEDKGVGNRYYLGLQVVPWDKYCDYIRDIKIIDTIQENKLGLIK